MSANIDDQIEYAERLLVTAGKDDAPYPRSVVRQMDRDKRCIEAIIETLKLTKAGNLVEAGDYYDMEGSLEAARSALKEIEEEAEYLMTLPGVAALSKEMAAVEKIIDLASGD